MKKCREEVLQQTKLRLREKYDIGTIELVEKHFWTTLRYYLTHPLEVPEGIMINRFFKLKLRIGTFKWKLENTKIAGPRRDVIEQLIKQNESIKKKFGKN